MTHAQRNEAILERINAYTTANTASKGLAQDALVREGFYLDHEVVAPRYAAEDDSANV